MFFFFFRVLDGDGDGDSLKKNLSTGWIFLVGVKKKDKNAKVKHQLTYLKPNLLTFGQYIKWFPKKV